jgi:hypothetical protein
MKQAFLILTLVFLSFQAQAQNETQYQNLDQTQDYQYDDQQEDDFQQQDNNPPPQYQARQGRWKSPARSTFNYFKASMGVASIDDYSDESGEINFDSSSVLPINLAYGVATGNVSFEAELGFSYFNYEYNPSFNSPDPAFDGDLGATKIMFNGFYKTSQTGSNLYIGGGLGLVTVSIDALEDELSGSSLATQFILGGEIRSNERSSIFIEYKQLNSVGLDLENSFSRLDFDFKEASLNIGVKYYF